MKHLGPRNREPRHLPNEHLEGIEEFGFLGDGGEIIKSADVGSSEGLVHELRRRKIVDVEEEEAEKALVSQDVEGIARRAIHQRQSMHLNANGEKK